MATTEQVYQPTTVQEATSKRWITVPSEYLEKPRFIIKIVEVLLSFVAFILEELVYNCHYCVPLYFFEFVSCTAFLFTTLLLILLATPLHKKVGIISWPILDFIYTAAIAILFFIASTAFAAKMRQSNKEQTAVTFGYLATIGFIVDAVFFVKLRGFPFQKRSTPVADGANAPVPESEKLNANGTDASGMD